MDTSSLVLGLRVLLALACVLGLMWYVGRRMTGSAVVRRQRATGVSVLSRQALGSKSGVALVEVAGRRLLLGVSEHGVTMLTEIEVSPEPATAERTERVELDPALLERLDPRAVEQSDTPSSLVGSSLVPSSNHPSDHLSNHLSTPAARMPAVPKPRNPLEGSILDAATWRQAMVAVQERTIRH